MVEAEEGQDGEVLVVDVGSAVAVDAYSRSIGVAVWRALATVNGDD